MRSTRPKSYQDQSCKLQKAVEAALCNLNPKISEGILQLRARQLNVPAPVLNRLLLEMEARDYLLRPEILRRVEAFRQNHPGPWHN